MTILKNFFETIGRIELKNSDYDIRDSRVKKKTVCV